MPSPGAMPAACPMKPSQTREAVGIPDFSTMALARITAGVQAPQPPTPDTTASMPRSFSRCGSAASVSCSSPAKVEPKAS